MHTKELIKNYKTPFTPMSEDASLLSLYMKGSHSTGFFENNPVFIIDYSFKISDFEMSLPTISRFFLEEKNRKYIKLYTDFLNKWEAKQRHFENFSKAFVFEKIKEVIDSFLTLNPSYVTFELTDDCSVFFQSSVNGFNIYFEVYFTTDLKDGVEAITNIYKDGKSVFAYGGSIEVVSSKIVSKVSDASLENKPTQIDYAVSESPFATTAF